MCRHAERGGCSNQKLAQASVPQASQIHTPRSDERTLLPSWARNVTADDGARMGLGGADADSAVAVGADDDNDIAAGAADDSVVAAGFVDGSADAAGTTAAVGSA